jgi:hypothetical protein
MKESLVSFLLSYDSVANVPMSLRIVIKQEASKEVLEFVGISYDQWYMNNGLELDSITVFEVIVNGFEQNSLSAIKRCIVPARSIKNLKHTVDEDNPSQNAMTML